MKCDRDSLVGYFSMQPSVISGLPSSEPGVPRSGKAVNARLSGMAKTVGYPLGIAAKLILQERISQRGLMIPVHAEIYGPVLEELERLGITFIEEEESLTPMAV